MLYYYNIFMSLKIVVAVTLMLALCQGVRVYGHQETQHLKGEIAKVISDAILNDPEIGKTLKVSGPDSKKFEKAVSRKFADLIRNNDQVRGKFETMFKVASDKTNFTDVDRNRFLYWIASTPELLSRTET